MKGSTPASIAIIGACYDAQRTVDELQAEIRTLRTELAAKTAAVERGLAACDREHHHAPGPVGQIQVALLVDPLLQQGRQHD